MDTPIPALDKVQTEAASGVKGLRLWIKGKSVELFAHEMRQLAAHLDAEADKLDPPPPPPAPQAPAA